MPRCFVADCNHTSRRDSCRFFCFPSKEKKPSVYHFWKEACRRDVAPGQHARVCSCHFVDGKKENGPTLFFPKADKIHLSFADEKFLKVPKSICSTPLEEFTITSSNGNSEYKLDPLVTKNEPEEIHPQNIIKQEKRLNEERVIEDPGDNVFEDEASNDSSFHLSWDDDMLEDEEPLLPVSEKVLQQGQKDLNQKLPSESHKKRRRKKITYVKKKKLKSNTEVENVLCTACGMRCSTKQLLKKHLYVCKGTANESSQNSTIPDKTDDLVTESYDTDKDSNQSSNFDGSQVNEVDASAVPSIPDGSQTQTGNHPEKYFFCSRKYRTDLFVRKLVKVLCESVIFKKVESNLEESSLFSFKCGFCSFSHQKLSGLKNHISTRHFNAISFKCMKCSFLRYYPSVFIPIAESLHVCGIEDSQNKISTSCRSLRDTFLNDKSKSINSLHSSDSKSPYKCGLCFHNPRSATALQKHFHIAHSNLVLFKCNKCNFSQYYPYIISKFVKSLHCCEINQDESKKSESPKIDVNKSDSHELLNDVSDFKCKFCPFTGISQRIINLHNALKHSARKLFSCPRCGFKKMLHSSEAKLFKHFCSRVKFICHFCNFSTRRSVDMYEHVRLFHKTETNVTNDQEANSDSVKWECGICGFSTKDSLGKVKEIKKQHTCASFNNLGRTANVMNGQSMVVLSSTHHSRIVSRRKFLRRGKFIRICHNSISLKSLEQNESTFKMNDLLTSHNVKVCAKKYRCSFCGLKTESSEELNLHLDVNHKMERSTICPWCNFSSYGITTMRRHIEIHHRDEVKSTPKFATKELRENFCPSCRLVGAGTSQAEHLRQQGHLNSRKLKFPCPHCTFTCFCEAYLGNHVKTTHAASSNTDVDRIEELLTKAPKPEVKRCRRRKIIKSPSQQKIKNDSFNTISNFSDETLIGDLNGGHEKHAAVRLMKGQNGKVVETNDLSILKGKRVVVHDRDFSEETDTSSEAEEVTYDYIDTGHLEKPLIEASEIKAGSPLKIKNSSVHRIWNESFDNISDDFNETVIEDPERDPLEECLENSSKDQMDEKEVIWKKVALTEWKDDLITYTSISDSDSEMVDNLGHSPRFTCRSCGKVFSTKRSRDIHSQKHLMQSQMQKKWGKLIRSNESSMALKIDGVLAKCIHCDFVTNNSNVLWEHLVIMHNVPYCYLCPFCHFKGPNNAIITAHVILDHSCGAEDVCTFCEHNYANLTHNHRLNFDRSNLGVRPYYCSGCDFICSNDKNFIQHVNSEHVEH